MLLAFCTRFAFPNTVTSFETCPSSHQTSLSLQPLKLFASSMYCSSRPCVSCVLSFPALSFRGLSFALRSSFFYFFYFHSTPVPSISCMISARVFAFVQLYFLVPLPPVDDRMSNRWTNKCDTVARFPLPHEQMICVDSFCFGDVLKIQKV